MRKFIGLSFMAGMLLAGQTAMATYHVGDHVTTDFNLQAAQGGTYTLSQFEGSTVILSFFYTT